MKDLDHILSTKRVLVMATVVFGINWTHPTKAKRTKSSQVSSQGSKFSGKQILRKANSKESKFNENDNVLSRKFGKC